MHSRGSVPKRKVLQVCLSGSGNVGHVEGLLANGHENGIRLRRGNLPKEGRRRKAGFICICREILLNSNSVCKIGINGVGSIRHRLQKGFKGVKINVNEDETL